MKQGRANTPHRDATMNPQLARACLVTCVVAVVVSLGAGEADSAAPGRTPAVVGVVPARSQWRLAPLDRRTLEPVPGSWSRRVTAPTYPGYLNAALVRSPRGTAVVASGRRTFFVDSRSGRDLRPSAPGVVSPDLYWVGGERVVGRGRASVFSVYEDYGSGDIWYEYFDLALGAVDRGAFADSDPQAVIPNGMLVWMDRDLMLVRYADPSGSGDFLKPRGVHPPMVGTVVADALHDRAFVISRDGTVARVDRISTTPRVTTHHVDLNGRGFQAAWAGQGKIAVWGQDGLGTIDTRTWTTQSVDADARSALATPHGIVAWAYGGPGVRVYRPDGTLRFTVLEDERITPPYDDLGRRVPGSSPPVVVGRYLYIVGDTRASIDLVSGRVVGRPRPDARVAAPTLVPIP
jgi:hypothetical protein